eukprot:2526848-Ditylum_brightwellii.AAC.1
MSKSATRWALIPGAVVGNCTAGITDQEWKNEHKDAPHHLDNNIGCAMKEPKKAIPVYKNAWWSEDLHRAHYL